MTNQAEHYHAFSRYEIVVAITTWYMQYRSTGYEKSLEHTLKNMYTPMEYSQTFLWRNTVYSATPRLNERHEGMIAWSNALNP